MNKATQTTANTAVTLLATREEEVCPRAQALAARVSDVCERLDAPRRVVLGVAPAHAGVCKLESALKNQSSSDETEVVRVPGGVLCGRTLGACTSTANCPTLAKNPGPRALRLAPKRIQQGLRNPSSRQPTTSA